MQRQFETPEPIGLTIEIGKGRVQIHATATGVTTAEVEGQEAEERANEAGQSLNTWLVNVVRAASRDGAINIDVDLSSIPFFGGGDPFGGSKGRGNKRMTGWL